MKNYENSWKFSMLWKLWTFSILWDDGPILMISGLNEQRQQQLEYTLLNPDCHSWWISKIQSDILEERYAIEFCFKLEKMPLMMTSLFLLSLFVIATPNSFQFFCDGGHKQVGHNFQAHIFICFTGKTSINHRELQGISRAEMEHSTAFGGDFSLTNDI